MNNIVKIEEGMMFGYWKVISIPQKGPLLCLCTGCNQTKRTIYRYRLVGGTTTSCGCQKRQKWIKTLKDRYGVENPQQNKEIRKKTEQTNLKKYGHKSSAMNSSVKKKKEKTCLERYGVRNPIHLDEISNKRKETMIERYGSINPLANPKLRKKLKKLYVKIMV